jgi:hypothetical protein
MKYKNIEQIFQSKKKTKKYVHNKFFDFLIMKNYVIPFNNNFDKSFFQKTS